ncbi:hypothetical protein J6590_083047 [Homalodisca vitripennis]|nr:hypothetical protein J6590_083047 [Homalodisca vitripennis]
MDEQQRELGNCWPVCLLQGYNRSLTVSGEMLTRRDGRAAERARKLLACVSAAGLQSSPNSIRGDFNTTRWTSSRERVVGFRLHGRPPLSSGRLATPGLPEPSCETLVTVLLELRSSFSLSDLSSTSFIFSGLISPTSSFLRPQVGVTSSFFSTGAYRRTRGVSLNCRRTDVCFELPMLFTLVWRQEPAPSGPSQEVHHGCRGRFLYCYGRPPARLGSGAGSTEVGPQETGVEAQSSRVHPFTIFPGRP